MNERDVEEARRTLLELQAVAAAVESSGQAKAEAQAQAEKLLIEGHSAIECELSGLGGREGRGGEREKTKGNKEREEEERESGTDYGICFSQKL